MSLDMYENKLRRKLAEMPAFSIPQERDPAVWRTGFPAWRAIFESQLLWGHSTGYRLPTFEGFWLRCERAYTREHPDAERFRPLFAEPHREGMKQRVAVWYAAGMAETHLNAALVQMIEDESRAGLVFYDPRADWKLKVDMLVVIRQSPIILSVYTGEKAKRNAIEARRDVVERTRKQNTAQSSHWGNDQLRVNKKLEIGMTPENTQTVNGIPLFSSACINRTLTEIYQHAGLKEGALLEGQRYRRQLAA